MLLTVEYCPELSVFRVHNGRREVLVTQADLEPGHHYHPCRELFDKAKAAVVEGRAVAGVCVAL